MSNLDNLGQSVNDEGETQIVNKYLGKPGLDDKEGKYRVLGAVTAQQVFKRKVAGTNIAPAVGYKVEEIATGRVMLVEKTQGVALCAEYGMRNAYVVYRTKTKNAENGDVLKTTPSVYLQPYPARSESFTQDDRLVTVFKMDAEGALLKPRQLTVTEEECTPELWRIIQKEYERGNKQTKKSRRGFEDTHKKILEDLKSVIAKTEHIKNPFNR